MHQRAYIIHVIDQRINPRFAYYYFKRSFKKYILQKSVNATVTSIRKPMLEKFMIPIPPLAVQSRVVDILDRFDLLCEDLVSGLPAEIEGRQRQYEYYRNKLLTFEAKV